MRRTLFLLTLVLLIPSSALLSASVGAVSQHQAAATLNALTPTPFSLPTQVFPNFNAGTFIMTEEGEIVELEGESQAVEPRPFEVGELVTETDHFRFHSEQGYLPVALEPFTLEAEEVYDYVSARLKTTTDIQTVVLFVPPDTFSCPTRGMTIPPSELNELPIVYIYANEYTSHAQVVAVLAHEIAHVLQSVGRERRWDSPHRPLNEGLATWAAGKYYFTWQGTSSFDASVRSYLDGAAYLPLYENYDLSLAYSGEDCIEKRDILYTEWAAFIDFLLTSYGPDQLKALLRSSPLEEAERGGQKVLIYTPADFEGVYGSALNQLEAVWLSYLAAWPPGMDAQSPNAVYQEALDRIKTVKDLGAKGPDLRGLGLTELPPEIGQLPHLQVLYLMDNKLTGLPMTATFLTQGEIVHQAALFSLSDHASVDR